MQLIARTRGWIALLVLAGVATSLMAPAAQADRGSWQRYKGGRDGAGRHGGHFARWADAPPARVIEVHHSSSGFSTLVGFLGGVALGAALSHRSQPEYVYEDPCGGQQYTSFDVCVTHVRAARHPRVVRVIETRTGECVHTYQYDHGQWQDQDPNYGPQNDGGDDTE